MFRLAATCYRYRELLASFIGRELRARFQGSLLGGFWMLLQPLVFLAVYYFVFVVVLKAQAFGPGTDVKNPTPEQAHYILNAGVVSALAMFVAMIPWQGLQESVARCSTTVGENGNLIKKIAFPSELLPVYIVAYNLINVVVGLLIYVVAAKLTLNIWPEPRLLWIVPVTLFLQGLFMLGLGYLLAATTVFVRDLIQLVPMVMTIWFFMTPIVWGRAPDASLQWIVDWNPAAYMVGLYRSVLIFPPGLYPGTVEGSTPWRELFIFAAVATTTLALGFALFQKRKHDFADEL